LQTHGLAGARPAESTDQHQAEIVQVGDGPEKRETLLQAHYRLLGQFGQRHGHIFSGVLGQKLLLPGQMGYGADVGEATSHDRLRVVLLAGQVVQPHLNLEGAEVP
jgi:hypothetical protein